MDHKISIVKQAENVIRKRVGTFQMSIGQNRNSHGGSSSF